MLVSGLIRHVGLVVVLLVYFGLTLYTSWQLPLSVGPDEVAHYELARFLVEHNYLPRSEADLIEAGYKSDQPPLNAILISAFAPANVLDEGPTIKLTDDIPRRRLAVDGVVNTEANQVLNRVVHNEEPLAGEYLLWRTGRFASILFSGITLLIIYFIGLKAFEDTSQSNYLATVSVMIVAFIPTFTFISSVFSYENLLGVWLALYTLIALHMLKGNEAIWLYFVAGVCVGLAIITKLSALTAPLSLIILIGIIGLRSQWTLSEYRVPSILGVLGVFIGAGWWFIWIEFQFNKVAELGVIPGLLAPLASDNVSEQVTNLLIDPSRSDTAGVSADIFFAWLNDLFVTFWSWYNQNPAWIFSVLLIATLLAFIGLLKTTLVKEDSRWWLGFFLVQIILFLILPFVRLFVTGWSSVAGQGQHLLFPTVGVIAVLFTAGLAAYFPSTSTKQWLGGLTLGSGLLLWNVVNILFIYQAPVPVPVRTAGPLFPETGQALSVDFGLMELTGYELKGVTTQDGLLPVVEEPAIGLNLYWLAKETASEDYLTTVNLVDEAGQIQTLWTGHGVSGRYPTRAWEPDEIIRDEIYLPVVDLRPGTYTINLEMTGIQSQTPLGNGPVQIAKINLPQRYPALAQTSEDPLFTIWRDGEVSRSQLVVDERSTIQVTAEPNAQLSLIGPDQQPRSPLRSAGQTQIFIIDPIWPKGDYRLELTLADQIKRLSEPMVAVRGVKRQAEPPNSQVTIDANFANQLMLLGYDLPKRHLVAGEILPVSLHWQALQVIPADFIMFTRFRDETGQVWGGRDRWPREVYSPILWGEGEVVEDGFTLETRSDTPAGLYYLDVGFYLPVGEAAISLPLVQNGEMSELTSVSIGPFQVGPRTVDQQTLTLQSRPDLLNQPFGDQPHLTLIDYDLVELHQQTEPAVKLTLYWRSNAPLFIDYTTFVHLLDEQGQIVTQKDQVPLAGMYPTTLWRPGELVVDEVVMAMPVPLASRNYTLSIGLYDPNTGDRLPLFDRPENSLQLAYKPHLAKQ